MSGEEVFALAAGVSIVVAFFACIVQLRREVRSDGR